MPRPLLCPPSRDHPPCPPDSCVSDWGPESTPNPACSGARVFLSPLPHFSDALVLLNPTAPQPRPGLCIPPTPPGGHEPGPHLGRPPSALLLAPLHSGSLEGSTAC